MSQMELLVTNVAELLTAAVQEVLQLMGQAVFEYQRESARARLENQTLQQKLQQLQDTMTRDSSEMITCGINWSAYMYIFPIIFFCVFR